MSNSTTTKADVTVTKNNDGSFSMSGIATSSTNMVIGSFSVCKDKYYAMSGIEGYTTSDVKISSSTGDAFPSGSRLTEYVDAGNLRRIRQAQITEYDINVVVIITNGTNYNGVTIYPMIEQNNQVTTYEPYISQTQLLSNLPELAKIGDYTDKIFHAVQGNSIYDSLDSTTKASLTVGSWYKENAISKVTLNGGQDESWSASTGATGYSRFLMPLVSTKIPTNDGLNNRFFQRTTQAHGTYEYLYLQIGSATTSIYIQIEESRLSTQDVATFKTWLSNNNVIAYYVQAIPTYTEITDTTLISQLENILKMHTYKNVTNAWIEPTGTNAQGGMVLVYRQDIQTRTDKIDSLEARVTLLE